MSIHPKQRTEFTSARQAASCKLQAHPRGFTLIELMVAVSLFAVVATLASGAYLVMLDTSQRAQASAIGIDNLAFALTTMTRAIRTGSKYNCDAPSGGDCSSGTSLYFTDQSGTGTVEYSLTNGTLYETDNGGTPTPLTEPSVQVTDLTFTVNGSVSYSASANHDTTQPYVFITVSGNTSAGPGKTVPFSVQTSAVMRGTDL